VLPDLSDAERQAFRRHMGRAVRDVVREAAGIEDPAELEQLGFELCESLALAPTGIPDELMAMIAAERDGLSLLRGIAAAASPPVSRLAAAYAAGLDGASASPAADRVGTLVPERAFRLEADEPISSLVVAARRPGAPGVQILGFTQEWPATDGAIKDGFASGTGGRGRARSDPAGDGRPVRGQSDRDRAGGGGGADRGRRTPGRRVPAGADVGRAPGGEPPRPRRREGRRGGAGGTAGTPCPRRRDSQLV
jgi:hypothetical protein